MSLPSSPSAEPPNVSTALLYRAPPSEEQGGRKCLILAVLFMLVCVAVSGWLFAVTLEDIWTTPGFYLSDLRGPPLDANPGSAVTVCQFTISDRARLLVVDYLNFDITLRHPSGREATGTITGFYQGPFYREARADVSLRFGNDTLAAAPGNRSATEMFSVSLETMYRYEGASFTGTWTAVRRGSDVEVNADGKMTSGERILLVSASDPGVASKGWLAVAAAVGSLIFMA